MSEKSPISITKDLREKISAVLGTENWVLYGKDSRGSFYDSLQTEDGLGRTFRFTLEDLNRMRNKVVSSFNLAPMPGCCGILISTGAFVYTDYRGKGLGTLLNLVRIELAEKLGYGVLFCTDRAENKPQARILEKNGWEEVYRFINPRTENQIALYVFDLAEE